MNEKMTGNSFVAGIAALMTAILVPCVSVSAGPTGQEVIEAAGVHGGLIVHLGCGDGRLTGELLQGDSFLVHGLDTNPENVLAARQHLQSLGRYGRVSVGALDGVQLPYVDNLVNLLVVSGDRVEVSDEEIERVLCPGGVAVKLNPEPEPEAFLRKPWPESIDEWGHFLHGPDNNAVAEDREVGPPRHMQWLAGPRWTRDHHSDKGTNPTVRSVVSARGRLYYIIDEAGTSDLRVPPKWVLAARDGFSGVLLWRKPLSIETTNRRLEQVWRGLIADGEFVYTSLGAGQPLAAIDGTTGDVVRTYDGTVGLQEVIKSGETLYVTTQENCVLAIEAGTGRALWKSDAEESDAVIPLTLAASGERVFVKTEQGLRCLAADDGREVWKNALPTPKKRVKLRYPHEKLIVKDGVVLCSYGGEDPKSLDKDSWEYLGSHPRVREYGGRLGAFAVKDGRRMWEAPYYPGLESMPGEIYVSGGQVWLGPDFASPRDLRTGEMIRTDPVLDRLWTTGHHYRCYPGKATSSFVLTSKRGIELIDMTGQGKDHSRNNWVRGTCRVGVTPCNGLLYAPPHSCGCYMEAKLFGFWALAGEKEGWEVTGVAERLERGPAYGAVKAGAASSGDESSSWPTYRADAERSGGVSAGVPAQLKPSWATAVGGRLSGVTVGEGKVFVSQVDAHTIVAMDAADGEIAWQFTAGGRVDSPPTVYQGLVLFGSADGSVVCLRASDGEMVWRFLAAPQEQHAVARNQVESLWPVHGSVLVKDGVAYAAAGRSSYLDGGIYVYGLDPLTGEVVNETRLADEHVGALDRPGDDPVPGGEEKIKQNAVDYKTLLAPDRSDAFSMKGALTDVMSAEGDSIYMRQLRFDGQLNPRAEKRAHLFSTSSLLDDMEHNRSYWALGTGDFSRTPVAFSWMVSKSLAVPYGLMLALGEETVWGIRRGGSRDHKEGYALFAVPRPDPDEAASALPDFAARDSKPPVATWSEPLTMRPRSMIRAGDALLVGGLAEESSTSPPKPEDKGLLHIASSKDGAVLQQVPLDASPVWDGMAAADGCVYAALVDGKVVCLK